MMSIGAGEVVRQIEVRHYLTYALPPKPPFKDILDHFCQMGPQEMPES
jgi:hypothetical protein